MVLAQQQQALQQRRRALLRRAPALPAQLGRVRQRCAQVPRAHGAAVALQQGRKLLVAGAAADGCVQARAALALRRCCRVAVGRPLRFCWLSWAGAIDAVEPRPAVFRLELVLQQLLAGQPRDIRALRDTELAGGEVVLRLQQLLLLWGGDVGCRRCSSCAR
jgi:hypothetical protein